jgi:hypothetical protein
MAKGYVEDKGKVYKKRRHSMETKLDKRLQE